YWYAHVLGIFMAVVRVNHPVYPDLRDPQHVEFLWVRWFGDEPGYRSGFVCAHLPQIGFVPSQGQLFGFLGPSQVICGCHLVPLFTNERTDGFLLHGPTIARPVGQVNDWLNYWVNIFVDRDMLMWFFRGGVGH
ncbi:hypothetical protein FISHEDRAFT_30165, partial [Fistulina hepatica ATCC 64428]